MTGDALRAVLLAHAPGPRIDGYYLEVARVFERALDPGGEPRVAILSGPQGAGKSTLAQALVATFEAVGVSALTLSIDDFYLTRAEQLALAARYAGNPYLEHRGYPGTHDVALGEAVLEDLRRGRRVKIPRYDKAAFGGRGDRAPESTWRVERPARLIIFEGWMLGFSPAPPELATGHMRAPNELLAGYAGWNECDALALLRARDLGDIVAWRVDSERARRARGEPALSDEDARDYIERFLPAYELYVPPLAARARSAHGLVVELGADRLLSRSPKSP